METAFSDQHSAISTDSEFDQTAQHVHMPASVCPVPGCDKWQSVQPSAISDRHVSPSILEFRIKELEAKNQMLRAECKEFREYNIKMYKECQELRTKYKTKIASLTMELNRRFVTIRELRERNFELDAENSGLRARIEGFERMAAGLSVYIDKAEAIFKNITGTSISEFRSEHAAAESTERDAAA